MVFVDGKPLTQGKITFVPPNARPAYGTIGKDGRFHLETFDEGDGCVPGEHKVAIIAYHMPNGGTVEWRAPKLYADIATTPLRQVIDGPRDDLKFEVSWEGKKPLVEHFGSE